MPSIYIALFFFFFFYYFWLQATFIFYLFFLPLTHPLTNESIRGQFRYSIFPTVKPPAFQLVDNQLHLPRHSLIKTQKIKPMAWVAEKECQKNPLLVKNQ